MILKILKIIPKKWLLMLVVAMMAWGWQQIYPQQIVEQVDTQSTTPQKFKLSYDKSTHEYISPAGLRYGKDPSIRFESRIDHVMAHTKHDLSKRKHSVFIIKSRDKLLQLLDSAWGNRGSPYIQHGRGRVRDVYIINMKTRIGEKGQTQIKMIVESGTSRIITAYPY